MEKYDPKTLEPKWQQVWADTNLYHAIDGDPRPKYYMLTEFPYPSAAGLHAGHVREYTVGDVIARYQRMKGHNTLYPMGWDAFGLPTENYAIKMKIKPQDATRDNLAIFRRQLQSLGLGIDWDREVNTSDPKYYKWTQWLFLQFLKAGLAYQAEIPINWCPKEKTGLANEEVVNGLHERCGTPVEKKLLKQWMLKITAYADRLVEGLKTVDYPPRIADQQINWIGRSEGAEIDFAVNSARVKRFVILHGRAGSPTGDFHSWLKRELEQRGFEVQVPSLPNSDEPDDEEQADYVEKHCVLDERTVIVGHSMGGIVAARLLERGHRVQGLILASTPYSGKFDDKGVRASVTRACGKGFDFSTIRSNVESVSVMRDTTDHIVPAGDAAQWSRHLKAPLIEVAATKPHFTGEQEQVVLDAALQAGLGRLRRVVLMHGKNVTPLDKWYPWLGNQVEAAGLSYQAPELTADDKPKIEEWTGQLSAAKPDASTVLVGHSRGGVAILRWLEQAPRDLKVGRVVLVATNRGDKPDAAAGDFFYTGDYDFAKIKSHCDEFVVIHSRDDDWVPFEHGEHIAAGLGAPLIAPAGKGHFGKETPEVPDILLHVLRDVITVFTTRPDTLAGATFLVLAPEHPAVQRITTSGQRDLVEKYIKQAQRQTDLQRQEEERPKTGVFTGAYAENPITKAKMPIWVADYVLAGYGTGAIMAVPAHDERDFAFANAMNAQLRQTEVSEFIDDLTPPKAGQPVHERVVAQSIVQHPTEDKILLQRKLGWQTESYSFPIGGIQPGETPMAAALRELQEETGYHDVQSAAELAGPHYVQFYHEFKQINRRSHVTSVLVKLNSLHQLPLSPEERGLHELIWMDPVEAVANVHGEGCRRILREVVSGSATTLINIPTVVEPDVVRDDAKDFKEFVKKRKIVATVENDKGEILTINWGPKLGGRLTVGGTIEGDESPAETALREVTEETGYEDMEVMAVSPETYHYKYYAHSKKRACDADIRFVHMRLRSDKRHEQRLEEDEKGFFKVEWVSREQADRDVTDPLHRYGLDKWIFGRPYTGYGPLINSGRFDGLSGTEAKHAITKWLYDQGLGRGATKYRLRDWIFSRQHYWGEPIPVIHCPKDGAVPVPDDQLPVTLPEVEHYEPTDTGESPLAAITEWVNTTCPVCGGPAKRETDTMPNWAGSSWYWLRYTDPKNDRAFADPEKLKYWTPVDLYLGGMEHTTLHLLYSRFWNQFMYDQGLVPEPEPFAARRGQGIVLAPDNRKMSKSLGNVIDPSDIIARYGADAFRLYILFMAPYDETTPWSDERLNGVSRFAHRVWTLATELIANREPAVGESEINTGELAAAVDRTTHKTLKKIHGDLDGLRFNTMVSTLMEFVNFLNEPKTKAALTQPVNAELAQRTVRALILMLAPAAPHLTEELWHRLGEDGSVHTAPWPMYDPELIKDDLVTIVVQVNGKFRGQIVVAADAPEADVVNLATAEPRVAAHLEGQKIVNTIVVPRKLVNFVVK